MIDYRVYVIRVVTPELKPKLAAGIGKFFQVADKAGKRYKQVIAARFEDVPQFFTQARAVLLE